MWPFVGKVLMQLGKAVAIEVGAKHLINKITKTTKTKDCINQLCSCSGTFVIGDEHDQHNGVIVCSRCGLKIARYKVTQHKS